MNWRSQQWVKYHINKILFDGAMGRFEEHSPSQSYMSSPSTITTPTPQLSEEGLIQEVVLQPSTEQLSFTNFDDLIVLGRNVK